VSQPLRTYQSRRGLPGLCLITHCPWSWATKAATRQRLRFLSRMPYPDRDGLRASVRDDRRQALRTCARFDASADGCLGRAGRSRICVGDRRWRWRRDSERDRQVGRMFRPSAQRSAFAGLTLELLRGGNSYQARTARVCARRAGLLDPRIHVPLTGRAPRARTALHGLQAEPPRLQVLQYR
jgi:hypothetical protein